ncbi:MAG: hypothetical protein GY778_16040 [bacterium]|nr:hypothetical protein [bacterium]
MFKALADRAPKALREAGREINSRHAQAMRRRRIPRRTGRLEESLTRVGHPERVFISSAKLITVGTRVPYAQYHAHRITKLTRQERTFVFTEPIALVFHEALARGGV